MRQAAAAHARYHVARIKKWRVGMRAQVRGTYRRIAGYARETCAVAARARVMSYTQAVHASGAMLQAAEGRRGGARTNIRAAQRHVAQRVVVTTACPRRASSRVTLTLHTHAHYNIFLSLILLLLILLLFHYY